MYHSPIGAAISASLSTISSALIILIIARSEKRLSTIYHRIMFCMSAADIISSVAMALTTIPMPSQVQGVDDNNIQWDGPMLGNISTCGVQALCQLFGTVAMYGYNAALCVYYFCAIALGMKDERITKRLEWSFHFLPTVISLGFVLFPLHTKMYNPSKFEPWCTTSPLPDCESEAFPDLECARDTRYKASMIVALLCLAAIISFVIIGSLAACLWKIVKLDRQLAAIHRLIQRNGPDSQGGNFDDVLTMHSNSKVVFFQACAYIATFVLTLSFTIAYWFQYNPGIETGNLSAIDHIRIIILPLQGFFNFFIFLAQKIYINRKSNPRLGVWHIILKIISSPEDQEIQISRITSVEYRADEENNWVVEDTDGNISMFSGQSLDSPGFEGNPHIEDFENISLENQSESPRLNVTYDADHDADADISFDRLSSSVSVGASHGISSAGISYGSKGREDGSGDTNYVFYKKTMRNTRREGIH